MGVLQFWTSSRCAADMLASAHEADERTAILFSIVYYDGPFLRSKRQSASLFLLCLEAEAEEVVDQTDQKLRRSRVRFLGATSAMLSETGSRNSFILQGYTRRDGAPRYL